MYRALLFDLYDTVVTFHPRVPATQIAGTRWRTTMGWMTEAVTRELPGVAFDDFLRAITDTTAEIVRNRPPEYFEVPSPERFRRALLRLGIAEEADAKASRLSRAHMEHLAAATELPAPHLALIRALSERFPLGLVSNFDHGPTARVVIDRHGLTTLFRSIVISDGFGRRKPHPTIFRFALNELGVDADDAVFIGDSAVDDVAGAHASGIDAVWINARGAALPEGVPPPRYVVTALGELPDVLGIG
ncbi:MAG TPA: HAD family hydrolase [Candidatus Binatia bacterium]|nr:HAD family hydrolase [Candidatus Binatia bacterium]